LNPVSLSSIVASNDSSTQESSLFLPIVVSSVNETVSQTSPAPLSLVSEVPTSLSSNSEAVGTVLSTGGNVSTSDQNIDFLALPTSFPTSSPAVFVSDPSNDTKALMSLDTKPSNPSVTGDATEKLPPSLNTTLSIPGGLSEVHSNETRIPMPAVPSTPFPVLSNITRAPRSKQSSLPVSGPIFATVPSTIFSEVKSRLPSQIGFSPPSLDSTSNPSSAPSFEIASSPSSVSNGVPGHKESSLPVYGPVLATVPSSTSSNGQISLPSQINYGPPGIDSTSNPSTAPSFSQVLKSLFVIKFSIKVESVFKAR
jgi:hypothetical protein